MPKWKKIHLGLLFTDPQVTHIIPGHWDVDRCVLDSVKSLKHWFNEDSVLTELSGVVDSVTGETFEILREMSPQLDAAWGTASTRIKMVLKTEPQRQSSIWERLIVAAVEEAADRNAYAAYPAEAHQEDVFRTRTNR